MNFRIQLIKCCVSDFITSFNFLPKQIGCPICWTPFPSKSILAASRTSSIESFHYKFKTEPRLKKAINWYYAGI